jgi:hypothetical protein
MPIVNQTSEGLAGLSIYDSTLEQKFALGTRTRVFTGTGKDKSAEVVYVRATAALTVGLLYELPLIAGTDAYLVDTAVTTTNAGTFGGANGGSFACCVPAVTIPITEYGWAFVSGHFPMFLGLSCAAQVKLYTTATAGLVDDDATPAREVIGAWAIAAVGGANAVADVFCVTDLRVIRNT